MITVLALYPSIGALVAAYRAAGGTIGSAAADASGSTVNCAGAPPVFFKNWTYYIGGQFPNLHKGIIHMPEGVVAVRVPSQRSIFGWTSLDVILRELGDMELVGAHVAEWYCRPGNLAAFLAVCPSGRLVFLEKYLNASRFPRVVCLYVKDGKVYVDDIDVHGSCGFSGVYYFAIRCKLSA